MELEGGPPSTATTVPTPGRRYAIQFGKGGLLTTAGRAYKLGPGQARLARAQAINSDAQNRQFWVPPENAFERQHFSDGIISFRPIFTCGEQQKRAQQGQRKCFARIFIPSAAKPARPRPNERGGCGVPPRTFDAELELEFEHLEQERAPARVVVRPRLCFFQNHSTSSHRNHFNCGASAQARHIGAIAAPVAGSCRRRRGSTPYDTGADIIAGIDAASACLSNRSVDDVHIFSHAGASGVFGTTGGSAGLYEAGAAWIDRADGGRTVADIPTGVLAGRVRFVLHGCNTAADTDNVARSLYDHLAATLDDPRVYGHTNSGCAGRNSHWREYSNCHPSGRNLRSLTDIVSNRPSGGRRRGCCGGT